MFHNKFYHVYKKNNIFISLLANQFFPTVIIFVLFLSKNFALIAEVAVVSSFVLLLINIFSGNARSLILADKDIKLAYIIIFQRSIISIFIVIISFILTILTNIQDIYLGISIATGICVAWVMEMVFTKHEIEKKNNLINTSSIVLIIIVFLLLLFSLLDKFYFIKLLIYFYVFYLFLLFCFYNENNFKLIKINLRNFFLTNFFELRYISSISISLSNFLFRLFLIIFSGKDIAGILFVFFALGSMPATILKQISFIKILNNNGNFLKIFFIWLFLSILLVIYLITEIEYKTFLFLQDTTSSYDLSVMALIYSLLGSNLMILSMYLREKEIYKKNRELIFNKDLLYSLSVISIFPFIYIFFENKLPFYCTGFFLSSIFGIFFYNRIKINLKNYFFLIFFITLFFPFSFLYYDFDLNFYLFYNLDQKNNYNVNSLYSTIFLVPIIFIYVIQNAKKIFTNRFFVTTSLIAIIVLTLYKDISFKNYLNLLQFLYPIFFLILGEAIFKNLKNIVFFFRIGLIISFFYFLILNLTLLFDIDIIQDITKKLPSSYIELKNFFLISISFVFLNYLRDNNYYKRIFFFLFLFNISIFVYLNNKFLLFYGLIILYYFCIYIKEYYLKALALVFFFAILIFDYKNLFILAKEFLYFNDFYISLIIKNINIFFFGLESNFFNLDQYKNSYFLDFIMNFGFFSITPLFILFIITYSYILKKRFKSSIFNLTNFFFFFLVLPALTYSLSDMYTGPISFLFWSLYIVISKSYKKKSYDSYKNLL